jgi:hypothetical protein
MVTPGCEAFRFLTQRNGSGEHDKKKTSRRRGCAGCQTGGRWSEASTPSPWAPLSRRSVAGGGARACPQRCHPHLPLPPPRVT